MGVFQRARQMTFSDVIEIAALYAGFATTVFAVAYGYGALVAFFRALASPPGLKMTEIELLGHLVGIGIVLIVIGALILAKLYASDR